jgi:hypothetical protein
VLLAIIGGEQAIIPFAMGPATVSPFYGTLAASGDRSALLEVPIGDPPGPYQSDYLLAQTIHGRPIVGGYISRVRVDPFIEGSPGVREFRYVAGPPDIVAQAPGSRADLPPLAQAARALLQANGIGTILVHTDQLTDTQTLSATTALAVQISGSPPVYTDAGLRAYTVSGTPDPAQVILQLGAGWSAAGIEPGATSAGRWADQRAELLITAFAPHTVALEVTAAGYPGPRTVQVQREGAILATWALTGTATDYTLPPLAIPAGVTRLMLVSASPAGGLPKPTPFDKAQVFAILRATKIQVVLQDR